MRGTRPKNDLGCIFAPAGSGLRPDERNADDDAIKAKTTEKTIQLHIFSLSKWLRQFQLHQ